ncbi:hypothetical protein DFH06DRAFT_1129004 [Mycena polygramma]|nr:hypothetical protein DFH06DRAFT_1129004 [Mycena polygramma]
MFNSVAQPIDRWTGFWRSSWQSVRCSDGFTVSKSPPHNATAAPGVANLRSSSSQNPCPSKMRSPWLLLVPALCAAAGPTNRTVDDASAQVKYLGGLLCGGCHEQKDLNLWGFDGSKLQDGTFSLFSTDTVAEFNFSGTAVYIFLALSPRLDSGAAAFFLDGVPVRSLDSATPPSEAHYNVAGYTNASIPDGPHTFKMQMSGGAAFDYAVYTSSSQLSSGKKLPAAAIAGAVVGAVALILMFLINGPSTPPDISPPGRTAAPLDQQDVGLLAEQMQRLTDEVQQLRQQVKGSHTTPAGPESASLGRSLSTMKREQTRALQQHGAGSDVTNSLVYNGRQLQLTAGRAEDDLPPTYGAD